MGWYHMGICWRMKRRCLRRVWASTAVPLGGNGAASSTFTTSICADSTQFMNRHGGSGLMAERAVWQERGGEANVPTPFVWKHGHACTKCIARLHRRSLFLGLLLSEPAHKTLRNCGRGFAFAVQLHHPHEEVLEKGAS